MKKVWIIIILIVFIAGGVFAWQYFGAPKEVKSPEKVLQDETANTSTSSVQGWQTYRNEEFGFELRYPDSWKVIEGPEELTVFNDEHGESFISLALANRAELGISFCGAYPEDKRCEVLKAGNTQFIIDWGLNGKAVAETDINGDIVMFITLHKVTDDTKKIFNQILSTFRFMEKTVLRNDIRTFDFKAYFDSMPLYSECLEYYAGVYIGRIEYYDFTKDGNEEAVVAAKSCFGGTGGDDIFGIFAFSQGNVIELPMNDTGFISDGLRGKMVFEIHDGKLIQIFPIYLGNESNCCAEGGTREFTYEWNGKEFVIRKVEDIPLSL